MIPKIIHYCWFGGNPLPSETQKYIESWKKYCPDYEIKEWNEKNFDINSNIYVKEAYENKKWAFITDYVRLYALYHDGGIYMDTDVELLKNPDEFLKHTAFSGFENEKYIPTALMASEKHGEWVKYLLSYYDNRHFIKPDGTLDTTTNVITITNMTKSKYHINLDNTYQDVGGIFTIYPNDYFCPKSYKTGEITLTKNTVCIHHFNSSWHGNAERLREQKKKYYYQKYDKAVAGRKYRKWQKRNKLRLSIMRNGFKKTFVKAVKELIKIPIIFVSKIVYGNNVILFESLNGFDGNSGAIYDYLLSDSKYDKYKFVWYVKKCPHIKKIDSRTWVTAKKDKSLKAVLLNSAAQYAFFDNVPERVINNKTIFVNITHGAMPIKNVKGIINVPERVDYVLCTSENIMELLADQKSVNINKMFVCGLPRNDRLYEKNKNIEKLFDKDKYNHMILWMPTFRKAKGMKRNDSAKNFALGLPLINSFEEYIALNDFLKNKNVLLIIKLHPGQDLSVIKVTSLSNIMLISDDDLKKIDIGINSVMPYSDALLTDYSSASFDYMLLNKPIGYIVDDMKEYKLGFSLEDPFKIMPGDKIYNTNQMYTFIDDIINGSDKFAEERNNVCCMVHKYRDNNNCKRLVEYFGL